MGATILIVDDEKNIRRTLRMVLEGAGHQALDAESAEEGLRALEENEVDLVILDVRLPGISGIDALKRIREKGAWATLPVIMISGHASVQEAVNAVQLGATDFFEKPLDRDRVLISVTNALTSSKLQREVDRLRAQVSERYDMIGESPVMKELFASIEKVAPTKGRVLITGESGTGKELIARAIHQLSQLRQAPFVKVNCAAIPAELIESELFGHERGAFTGAQLKKKGVFEQADGGTLLLDEIGDMSPTAQAKVLRALQNGEINRVGSERTIAVDVRVIAATNKDLEDEVENGSFREDLFFRLNVVPIRSPSLRERVEDIPLLAQAFLRSFAHENGVREKPVDAEVFRLLQQRPWRGNVRELKNVVERMAILSGDRIRAEDVPENQGGGASPRTSRDTASASGASSAVALPGAQAGLSLRDFRDQAESAYIVATLDQCDWNISRAASQLGVERTNLHKKMRVFGIRRAGQSHD
jgi:two-component system nitrogen regulation response regulator NtrX